MRVCFWPGEDPLDEKTNQRAAMAAATAKVITFERAAKAYLINRKSEWKSAVHLAQWERSVADLINPVIGKLPVGEITTADVRRVLDPIWNTTRETASRVRGRIEVILASAGRRQNNPAAWRGNLEFELPKRNKARDVEHLPSLPFEELPAFMQQLRAINGVAARALEFLILTAARTAEAQGAVWSEVDLTKRLWTLPAMRMKRDRLHEVPLSDRAVEILEEMAAIRQDDRVFPGLAYHHMLRLLRELREGVSTHGFRATFKHWAGCSTPHARDVVEEALSHQVGNETERAYRRAAMIAKRTVLMRDWADYCARSRAQVLNLTESAA